ncbi:glutamine amidotransferase-related protein [Bradyrhizobium altum]|uniref:glutamine amidotransferase-related protein n=1 Tax=Bradyrhizobium altum TaxID=1571202 RepID=UPI001E2CBD81|nr:gamma-glutamyl-gamma-aminobutyrate hydrolase family protein [Bradyrhizobium altum]
MRPPRSAIAIRHVAFEDLGLLAPIMERAGWSVSFCDAPVDDLSDRAVSDADLLIVLGGPIGVYETDIYPFLSTELALLEHRLRRGLPTLGICLCAQLMALALGGRVFPGKVKEIGWGPIDLTPDGKSSCLRNLQTKVLHWHGDTFDLPGLECQLREPSLRLRPQRTRAAIPPRGRSAAARGMGNGMSATPSNCRPRKSQSPNCARRCRRWRGRSPRKPSRCSATGCCPSHQAKACFVPVQVRDYPSSPLISATSTVPVTDSVM